ncbi:MAG TPA: META domain-containing protein [Xanthomonadales bacterium]|nr:META domain-containing protein [Xanthomonadales bacterium]
MARPDNQITIRTLVIVFLVTAGISACSRDDVGVPEESVAAEKPSTDEWVADTAEPKKDQYEMMGEWQLVAIDQQELSQGGTPTVFFGDEGKCWGYTGVNDFTTSFSLEGPKNGKVELGNAAVTRKAGPPEAMALENLFLDRFQSASSYEVEGDMLYLYSGEQENLTFRRIY